MSHVQQAQGSPKNELPSISRRDFLGMAVSWAVATSMGLTLIGLIKFPMPALFPDITKLFRIGKAEDYPIGAEKVFQEEKFVVIRDQEGLFAISLICTHLGCVVGRQASKFVCPCHGSKFDAVGKVTAGPAPKALPWLKILQRPDGKLVVNAMKEVPVGTKFMVLK